MLTIKRTSCFKDDLKRCIKRHYPIEELEYVVDTLAAESQLDEKYHDHPLSGNWAGYRECHIRPDWLLIYGIDDNKLILSLTRTGTHAELFNM